MAQITRKIARDGGCQGNHCPAVWETDDPQIIAVQGNLPAAGSLEAAGEIPAQEGVVFIPAALLRDLASGQQ